MNTVKRVLITGAGGFVGRHIAHAMLDLGVDVIAVDAFFDPELLERWNANWGSQIKVVKTEIEQLPSLEADTLIHGAAVTSDPAQLGQTPEEHFRANLYPLLTMLDWANRHQVRRSIFLSSSAVYRETTEGPVYETQAASPLGLYSVAKHTAENLIETIRKEYGRDVVAARLSNIYGIAERPRPSRTRISVVGTMISEAIDTGNIIVHQNDIARDWTFAYDVGCALYALLKQSTLDHHLYHVASGQVYTPNEIAHTIQSYMAHIQIIRSEKTNPISTYAARRGYLSNERLRLETGFDGWTPITKAIKAVIDWERSERLVQ